MPLDSRRRKRITITGDVIIDDNINAKALDFSEGGIYVFVRDHFRKGDEVKVSIPFREETVNLKAVVQHVEEGLGVGLRFFDIDSEQKKKIKVFLDYFYSKPLETNKKRVLLADGNERYRMIERNRLAVEGFDIFDAKDGAEALEILEEEKVDIVVADISLEKMDACKLLALMKQTPRLKDIPVLVLSATNNPEDVGRAASAGAVEVLPKMTTSPCRLAEKIRAVTK